LGDATGTYTPAREHYEREGYVILRDVLDAELIAEASDHVTWLKEKHPDLRPEGLGHTLVREDPFWVRLVSDERLLDRVEEFLGPNIALFASHYIAKPPDDGMPVLWHQDGSYWPLEPMEVITFWLAVDDSTPENGCMRVIPRTQHMELQELRERKDVPNVLNSGMDEGLVDEAQAVDIILKAGDVSVHHPNVIHGSNGNTSDRWRKGLTIRYIPTTTRIKTPNHPSSFLLRGEAVEGINEYHPQPNYVEGECMPFRGCEDWA
jgi:ectoine hydroxylase-related dioxygenase (phytanoyl-CoA dioxygenase family)